MSESRAGSPAPQDTNEPAVVPTTTESPALPKLSATGRGPGTSAWNVTAEALPKDQCMLRFEALLVDNIPKSKQSYTAYLPLDKLPDAPTTYELDETNQVLVDLYDGLGCRVPGVKLALCKLLSETEEVTGLRIDAAIGHGDKKHPELWAEVRFDQPRPDKRKPIDVELVPSVQVNPLPSAAPSPKKKAKIAMIPREIYVAYEKFKQEAKENALMFFQHNPEYGEWAVWIMTGDNYSKAKAAYEVS